MKKKPLGILFIFLVLFQFLSPWVLHFEKGFSVSQNTAQAQVTTSSTPKIGYQPYTGTKTDISGVVFVYVDVPESTGLYYGTDVEFDVNSKNFEDESGYDGIFWEIVDSDSNDPDDFDWEIELITDGGGTKYRRHFYAYAIEKSDDSDFPLYISAFNDDITNPVNSRAATDNADGNPLFEEVQITKGTYFGPTLPQSVINVADGTSNDTNEVGKVFSAAVQAQALLSDTDNTKIIGEFKISITNKYAKWQDTGNNLGKADNGDDYGGWDVVYDNNLAGEPTVSTGLTPENSGGMIRQSNIDFDGFILDISTSDKFLGNETKSININSLILDNFQALLGAGTIQTTVVSDFTAGLSEAAKLDVALPLGAGLDENKTYYYRIRIYPDYSGIESPYITANGSFLVPPKASLSIVQSSRNSSALQEASEQEDQLAWLPKCGVPWPVIGNGGSISGCLVEIFYYLLYVPTAYLLAVAGKILDWVLVYSISPTAYKAGYIIDGWRFIRDLCNLFFIFILIYLAFKVILNVGHGTKQLIVNTLIIATVINFSYPLTTFVIDASNITARQLYYNVFKKKETTTGEPLGLSATIVDGIDPQKLITEGLSTNKANPNDTKGTIFMVLLIGVVINIITIIVFLKAALQFISRIIGLVFALILSPLAVFSYSLDEKQRGKLKMVGFENWMSGLMSDAFKAPVFLFLVMILILFVASNPFLSAFSGELGGLEWWMSILIPFMLLIGFLQLITSVTKSMSSSLAEMATGAIMKGVGAVAGLAMGGVALAGSGLIGKAATKLAGSGMGQRIMDRAAGSKGLSGFVARQQAKAIRGMQSGSFDVRQTGIGNAISRETGANFNALARVPGLARFGTAATAGGYMSTIERRNEKREEFQKMLEWNKNLAADLESKKKETEDRKSKAEIAAKDQRAVVAEAERVLKDKEKAKKEADDNVSEIEKLEELLARRNDFAKDGKSTNEIDVQIDRIEAKLSNNGPRGALYTTSVDAQGNEVKTTNQVFSGLQQAALANKRTTKGEKEDSELTVKREKDTLKGTEDDIRQLDKDISALTEAIRNVKDARKNAMAYRIRNKSGGIFNRRTYQDDLNNIQNQTERAAAEQDHARVFGGLADQMRGIITHVDDQSQGVNAAFRRNRIILNTAIGGLVGVFTGGIGAIATGVATGGIVGIARSYRPDNERYGVPRDANEWRPTATDRYRPPNGNNNSGAPN